MNTKCCRCAKRLSARSKHYCEYHLGYQAGNQFHKRRNNPEFAEEERTKLRLRMRRLRRDRVAADTTSPG